MKLKIDPSEIVGAIKPMNAVNNGPIYTDNADQNLTNLPAFKAANIPYARVHDASICYDYGGSTRSTCTIYSPISPPTRIRPSHMTSR